MYVHSAKGPVSAYVLVRQARNSFQSNFSYQGNCANELCTYLIICSQSHGFGDYIRVAFYGDKVANIIWREKTLVTIIEDKEIREGYQKYFEYLWKRAGKS